MTVTRDYVMLY